MLLLSARPTIRTTSEFRLPSASRPSGVLHFPEESGGDGAQRGAAHVGEPAYAGKRRRSRRRQRTASSHPSSGLLWCLASDRFNINSQLEHLQAKYVGTGHADLNRFEWAVNIQRDSYASYIGHYPMLAYFSIAENESIGRERYNFMQKMLLPCGLPPDRDED
uniref:Splicing factor subunit n=1 Tax=Leersia perrieri TaxID=77586 RepID=A0A0D9X8E1_9ORYZ